MIHKMSALLVLSLVVTVVIVPAALAQKGGANGPGNGPPNGPEGPQNGPAEAAPGAGEGGDPGRGPGPGPTAGPEAEEGPRARECSVPGLLVDLPMGDLSSRELSDLAFIREEEKLARDTYLSMAQAWDLRVLLHGLIRGKRHQKGVAVQLELDQPDQVKYPDQFQQYLQSYFGQVKFEVYWGDPRSFLEKLRDEWVGV